MRPRAVHFNELNGQPLHINDHIWAQFRIGKVAVKIVIVIHCMIRLCNVCHNELFLPNLWKCRYHVYWNLDTCLFVNSSINRTQSDADQYIKKTYASSCSAFQRIEWPTFAYKWPYWYWIWELRFHFTEMRINTSKVILPNLWKCRYHVYWNLSYPLSILKVIFSKSNKLWLKKPRTCIHVFLRN
jgi:hypothetical protein